MLGGCYSYRVVPVEQAPVGRTVRARVSLAEAERLREVLGRDDRVVEGQLLAPPDSAVLVAVRTSSVDAAVQTHQRVMVPRGSLLELEVRRLDRWKTGGVVAVLAVAATAVALSQFNSDKPTDGIGKGGTDNSLVLPFGVSLRWGR